MSKALKLPKTTPQTGDVRILVAGLATFITIFMASLFMSGSFKAQALIENNENPSVHILSQQYCGLDAVSQIGFHLALEGQDHQQIPCPSGKAS
ncbi:hypothetical protein [Vibrio paucivorans]|uniref:Uncharacterized protein n=1 Tax=Vibrio paucivorans TaxID=2829489 RepID=A0A9X3CG16_9VIBR|nr:hypothetical protein [Vibrio paucivorans]MCW8335025.1 hypothetical protein [Vibrio paucivorans]